MLRAMLGAMLSDMLSDIATAMRQRYYHGHACAAYARANDITGIPSVT